MELAFRWRLTLFTMVATIFSIPSICAAQQPAKVVRLGYLTPIAQPAREDVFRQELQRLGYIEGKNIAIEYRSANGRFELLPHLAAELAGLKVDVIVAVVTQAALAAKKSTDTIPIVMISVSDPVQSGLVASLGRPGANVTGNSALTAHLVGKQLEMLRELLPKASVVAALWNPANAVFQKQQVDEAKASAMNLNVRLQFVAAQTPDDLERAFASIAKQKTNALIILGDPVFNAHAGKIATLAARHRVPAVAGSREFTDAGGLMTYGPDYADSYRRAAAYVDRILKGTKPADLPVEQPTTFELVINNKTAKALGITIPDSIAIRAVQTMK
jgi:putative ABC transport system substrate-binding protein